MKRTFNNSGKQPRIQRMLGARPGASPCRRIYPNRSETARSHYKKVPTLCAGLNPGHEGPCSSSKKMIIIKSYHIEPGSKDQRPSNLPPTGIEPGSKDQRKKKEPWPLHQNRIQKEVIFFTSGIERKKRRRGDRKKKKKKKSVVVVVYSGSVIPWDSGNVLWQCIVVLLDDDGRHNSTIKYLKENFTEH